MKLIGAKETVLLVPAFLVNGTPHLAGLATGSASIETPTKAILDPWIAKTSQAVATEGLLGGNISGAIRDDMQLGLTGSQRSTSRVLTTEGAGESLTYKNFQAVLNIFRDEDRTANGVFNLARYSTRVQGIPYILCHRINARANAPVTIGEDWSFFYAHTGQPVPGFADGEEQTINLTFVPKNIVNTAHAITA